MAEYKLTTTPVVIRTADHVSIPDDPDNTDRQRYDVWLEDGGVPDPADPLPLMYAGTTNVNAQAQTTDAQPKEIYRFPCTARRLYQTNLTLFGVDMGNFGTKTLEGRFVWKRANAGAVMSGITVVSDIHDTAAAAWAPNAAAQGNDIVFTVQGAAGRTINWQMSGIVLIYAPEGSTGGTL